MITIITANAFTVLVMSCHCFKQYVYLYQLIHFKYLFLLGVLLKSLHMQGHVIMI